MLLPLRLVVATIKSLHNLFKEVFGDLDLGITDSIINFIGNVAGVAVGLAALRRTVMLLTSAWTIMNTVMGGSIIVQMVSKIGALINKLRTMFIGLQMLITSMGGGALLEGALASAGPVGAAAAVGAMAYRGAQQSKAANMEMMMTPELGYFEEPAYEQTPLSINLRVDSGMLKDVISTEIETDKNKMIANISEQYN